MRPIDIKMTAFGPFAGTEEVNFESLNSNQLFVITGTTGSGKTSILDGITYALFGKFTGDYRDESQIKCQYSSNKVECSVELIFEVNNERYKIIRKPAQETLKKDGTLTKKIAFGEMYKKNDNNEYIIIENKTSKVTEKVQSILHYSVEQFRQVVVLPQGKFIDILNSSSKEREALLATILQTKRFEIIQNKLKEKTNALEQELRDFNERINTNLSRHKLNNN